MFLFNCLLASFYIMKFLCPLKQWQFQEDMQFCSQSYLHNFNYICQWFISLDSTDQSLCVNNDKINRLDFPTFSLLLHHSIFMIFVSTIVMLKMFAGTWLGLLALNHIYIYGFLYDKCNDLQNYSTFHLFYPSPFPFFRQLYHYVFRTYSIYILSPQSPGCLILILWLWYIMHITCLFTIVCLLYYLLVG